jgi:hypothetical protein
MRLINCPGSANISKRDLLIVRNGYSWCYCKDFTRQFGASSSAEGDNSTIMKSNKQHSTTIQVGAVKGIMPNNESAPQRYRLSLVDGKDSIQTMLGTQMNEVCW